MSSSGRIFEMTPLLPCRPAILSPTEITPLGRDVDLDHLLHAARQLVAALERVELAAPARRRGTGSAPGASVVDLVGLASASPGVRMSRLSSLNAAACSATTLSSLSAAERLAGVRVLELLLVEHLARGPSTNVAELRRRSSCCSAFSISFCSLSIALRSSSVMLARRLNRWVSMTMPSTPDGTSSESFFTSSPARPKIACSSFSSGVSSLLRLRATPCRPGCRRARRTCRCGRCRARRGSPSAFGRDVRDVAGELLLAELRLADLDLELLDVDRGVGVVLDQPLADDDRVLEVVAVPGHERDQHVAAQRQLAVVRGGAVGDDLALLDLLADLDDRLLVQAGPLVQADELAQHVLVARRP